MTNKSNLHYLLIHGWGFNNTIWQGISNHLNGGLSITAPCLYKLANEAHDQKLASVAVKLDALIKENTVVIAWSIGGLIAIYLSKLSEKLKAIVFIASAPCFTNRQTWLNTIEPDEINNLEEKLFNDHDRALDYLCGLVAFGDETTKNTIKVLRQCLANRKHTNTLSLWLHELKKTDLSTEFASLALPTYVLLGENDVLLNNKLSKQLEALNANAKYHLIKNCGHAPFVSKKAETLKLIEGFINEQFSK